MICSEASPPPTARKDCVVCESVNPHLMVNSMPRVVYRENFWIAINISECLADALFP